MESGNLQTPINKKKSSKYLNHKNFFKVYIFLILSISLYNAIIDDDKLVLVDYINYILTTVAFLGVFAYTFNKIILSQNFWQYFLPMIIIWDMFYTEYSISILSHMNEPLKVLVFLTIVVLISAPLYVGLYLYGHQNVDPSIKKRTKILILFTITLLLTNVTTYLLTCKEANFKWNLYDAGSNMIALEMIENNVSRAKTYLSIIINSTFYQASLEDDIEKYAPICKHLDDNIFPLLKKYQYESNDTSVIEPMSISGYDITQGTKKGKKKVIEMCKKLKAEEG